MELEPARRCMNVIYAKGNFPDSLFINLFVNCFFCQRLARRTEFQRRVRSTFPCLAVYLPFQLRSYRKGLYIRPVVSASAGPTIRWFVHRIWSSFVLICQTHSTPPPPPPRTRLDRTTMERIAERLHGAHISILCLCKVSCLFCNPTN